MRRFLSYFFTLLLSITVSSCSGDSDFELSEDDAIIKTPTPLNFLGDSIFDYWEDVSDFFPKYECHNYGWTAKGIDTFLGKVNIKLIENTICIIEIGTNDMRQVINKDAVDSYIEHYIDVLISLNAKRIYLLSLLPRNRAKDGGFDFNSYYPEINKKIQERVVTRMKNTIYIPMFDAFLKDGQINWEYTYDGLHPNSKGYTVMADIINRYLEIQS